MQHFNNLLWLVVFPIFIKANVRCKLKTKILCILLIEYAIEMKKKSAFKITRTIIYCLLQSIVI